MRCRATLTRACSTSCRRRPTPIEWLIEENARRRGSAAMEFELIDTGLFDEDRYFDVEVEYAKADADDMLMRMTVHNRGPEDGADPYPAASLVPQRLELGAWLQQTVAEGSGRWAGARAARRARRLFAFNSKRRIACCSATTRAISLDCSGRRTQGYFKDAFHDYVVHGRAEAVNPAGEGTKIAGLYRTHGACPRQHCRSRRGYAPASTTPDALIDLDGIFSSRIAEADAFYAELAEGHRRRGHAAHTAPSLCRHAVEQAVL